MTHDQVLKGLPKFLRKIVYRILWYIDSKQPISGTWISVADSPSQKGRSVNFIPNGGSPVAGASEPRPFDLYDAGTGDGGAQINPGSYVFRGDDGGMITLTGTENLVYPVAGQVIVLNVPIAFPTISDATVYLNGSAPAWTGYPQQVLFGDDGNQTDWYCICAIIVDPEEEAAADKRPGQLVSWIDSEGNAQSYLIINQLGENVQLNAGFIGSVPVIAAAVGPGVNE